MRLTVEGVPPSVNHMYRRFTTPEGKTMNVLTRDALNYRETVALIARTAANRFGWVKPPGKQKVIVRFWFFFPDARRRDSHNTTKLILDALEGVIYDDDYWAMPQVMDIEIDRDHPRVEIETKVVLSVLYA